jgi:DnaJ-domain-containing protein 1
MSNNTRIYQSTMGISKAQGLWSYPPELLWNLLEMARDNYKKYIREYHPDRFPNASPEEIKKNNERAAIINHSWKTIHDIFKRHGYELHET